MDFLQELSSRNPALYFFGWFCLLGSFISFFMVQFSNTEVLGINAWIKPLKFFLSAGIFSWSMAWYMFYLPQNKVLLLYSWTVILVFAFETIYIAWQASQGETSHFNMSTPFKASMWSLMGIAISIMTLFTLYIGILFFMNEFPGLPTSYVWGIRLGIVLFVIFAFEGAIMGSKLSHTVGGTDGSPGIPFLNWSMTYGDLRVAHFLGMHALQILPLLGFYLVSNARALIVGSLLYFLVATGALIQALMGSPLIKS